MALPDNKLRHRLRPASYPDRMSLCGADIRGVCTAALCKACCVACTHGRLRERSRLVSDGLRIRLG